MNKKTKRKLFTLLVEILKKTPKITNYLKITNNTLRETLTKRAYSTRDIKKKDE